MELESLDAAQITDRAERARANIAPFIQHTPVELAASRISGPAETVWLKHEEMQVTGSFKPRGSFTKLTQLPPQATGRGIVAPTAGNHGIGVAYAAHRLGVEARIFVPHDIDPGKPTGSLLSTLRYVSSRASRTLAWLRSRFRRNRT